MRESSIEKHLVKQIKKLGGICLKFTSLGTVGVPDRIVILPGGYIQFVELKSTHGVTSAIQDARIEQLRARGVQVHVCRSKDEVDTLVSSYHQVLDAQERF